MAGERTVLVRLKADVSGFNKGLMEAAAGVGALRKEINTTNERTAWLTQGIMAIAPAVVPLGAAAVPVFAGLAAQMTVAGVAAGTIALGFNGVGDALKALNTYQLEPTIEHLTKLQETMSKIGPDGAQFVMFLDSITPQLSGLADAARAGMFPGMETGIQHLMTLLPQVRQIISQVAEGIGQLADEAGSNLAGPKFEEFFAFLENDAKPILIEMGHTVGNLADGLAALFVDLLPEAKGFSSGLEDASASFARWAHSVDDTEGFQHFLDYVNQSGPQALDFIEALGNALLALIEAAAPVGSALLPVFTELLNVLSAIASTPLGSTLLAFGSLISLYGRIVAIGSNFVGGGMFGKGFADQTRAIKSGLPTMREFGNTALHSMHSVNQLNDSFATGAKRAIESRSAVTGWMRSVAPMAGQAALLGVVMTGLDKKVGLTNTTSLALAGSLAGPYGAAVGAAVGFTMDLAHSNDSLTDAVKRANDAINAGDYGATTAALANLQDQTSKTAQQIHDAFDFGKSGSLQGSMTALMDTFTHSSAEAEAAMQRITMQRQSQQDALVGIGRGLNVPDMQFGKSFSPNTAAGIKELTDLANRAQPAMEALGISMERLSTEPGPMRDKDVAAIAAWIKNADSAKGRAEAVGAAMSGLGNDMLTTEQKANALTQALNNLLGPKLGVNAAHNAYVESLRALNGQLDKNNKSVRGNSNAALKNQDAIRGVANNMLAYIQAQAKNGASSEQLTNTYRRQRGALIQTASQLGVNRGELIKYLRQIGFTPKAINTAVNLNGADQAMSQARSIQAALAAIDRVVNVHVNVTRSTNALLADVNTPHKADGGLMRGPGGPRDDMIPAWLSNGEFVVNAAATARNLSLLHSINAQRFADGGIAQQRPTGNDGGTNDAASRTARSLNRLQHAIDLAKKSVDAEKAARDKILSAQQSLRSDVTGGFRSSFLDVASQSGNAWGVGQDPFSILRGDIRNARAYRNAMRDLRRRGVHGQFAAQITTLGGAQQLDALSNRQLHQLEHLFTVRQHASAAAGQLAGQTAYGHQLEVMRGELRESNHHLKVLEAEMKHIRREARHHAKDTGDQVGKQINGGASRAVRRAAR